MSSYPSSPSQLLGQTIDNGVLRIEAILGQGYFGVVYRAVDTKTGMQYAVKRVEMDGVHSHYNQTREKELQPRVSSHPHILTFHREIITGGYAYFVYDLCARDLRSVISKMAFFREDELIKRVFIQIIDAVEYCHSRGVYHRDLKPENIFVSAENEEMNVFLGDFAVSTTSEITEWNDLCGTPCFMSPESLLGINKSHTNIYRDIWALGCILAEMISNVRLWSTTSKEDRYSNYLRDEYTLFDVLPISRPTHRLLRKIFSAMPGDRPSLAYIRMKVLEMDTFFMSSSEAAEFGWVGRLERMMTQKIHAREQNADALGRSSETHYSCGSSPLAFETSSGKRSDILLTPPALAAEGVGMGRKFSRLQLPRPRKLLRRLFERLACKLL